MGDLTGQLPDQQSLFDATDALADVQPLTWRVRTSKRVRNLKIQVFPHGGVEIVAPPNTRPRTIEKFVAEHTEWISSTRAAFAQMRPAEAQLPDTISLLSVRETIAVHYAAGEAKRNREQNGLLRISAATVTPQDCWPLLRDWLKKRAKTYLPEQCIRIGEAIGLEPARVHIRLQKTRWGSCSPTGTISLNAALMLRPPEEVRYVLIHELCHLQHLNHSKRYWSLVAKHVPD